MTVDTQKAITIATPSEREFTFARTFDAPRQLVFDAYTRPEHIQRWMLGPEGWTMPVCETDLRPGGAWHFVWRQDDGTEMEMRGVYREVVPPERIVNTESWGDGWPETTNTLTFTEEDGKTTLTCTILYPSQEARDAATQTGMMSGVEISYNRLDEVLASLSKEVG